MVTMGVTLVRRPFILRETIGMLYKYINGITFQSGLGGKKAVYGRDYSDAFARWGSCLQEMMEQVCSDVDVHDPVLRRFFVKTVCEDEEPCLADLVALSFTTLENPGFWENVEEVRRNWWKLLNSGGWISPNSTASLRFSCEPGSPGNLFKQVLALHYPAEFRLELYDALSEFDETLDLLAKTIEPYAKMLERRLEREQWLLDEICDKMEEILRGRDLLELIGEITAQEFIEGAGEETWLATSLMRGNILHMAMSGPSTFSRDHNVICMGCFVTPYSSMHKKVRSLDGICATLKCLSDHRRLEILQRLSKERSYCMELAESMGADSGNMSRTLALLHSFGFLSQEKEVFRTYYRTDRQVIHEFLEIFENTICGEG